MKHFILFNLLYFVGISQVLAYDLYVDGIYYNANIDYLTLEVTKGDIAYSGDIVIPDKVTFSGTLFNVTRIGDFAFYKSLITSIHIPSSVTRIGQMAFALCKNLTTAEFSNGLIYIDNLAFCECEQLMEVTIPASVKVIENGAFISSGIKTLILEDGDNTLRLGQHNDQTTPFQNSNIEYLYMGRTLDPPGSIGPFHETKLKEATISNNVKELPAYCFNGLYLTNLTIPASVLKLRKSCLNCSTLQELTLEDSDNPLYWSLYSKMPNLKKLYLGRNLDPEDYQTVFEECKLLENLTLGEYFSSFNNIRFSGDLNTITIFNKIPPYLPTSKFTSKTYLLGQLYVPEGCLELYKNATGWENFFNISEITSDIDEIIVPKNNGIRYNIMGQPVGKGYKGIVIENGIKRIIR